MGRCHGEGNRLENDLLINIMAEKNTMRVEMNFNNSRYPSEEIQTLLALYETELRAIVAHCISRDAEMKTVSDFDAPDLTEDDVAILNELVSES
jgi:non-ribosomal peptide synthase protein (TIGR01720 family)